jgi:SAM-dependent methyltransferase
MGSDAHSAAVRHYYERNTRRFLRLGRDAGTRHLHQPLHAPGIHSREDAMNYSSQLVLHQLQELAAHAGTPLHVLDLGCGTGSGLWYLAARGPSDAQYTGVTISPLQARLAEAARQSQPGGARCQIVEGDFLRLPPLPPAHLAYAIEAFLHAADPEAFFREAARVLVPGGRLLIIDDVLMRPPAPAEAHWAAEFRRGWLGASLIPPAEAEALAARQGLRLIHAQDLTPWMRTGRPRDRAIGWMRTLAAPLLWRSVYGRALLGGYAKQQCIRLGIVGYRLMVWEKS